MKIYTRAEVGYRLPKPGLKPAGNTDEIVNHWVGAPGMSATPTVQQSMATLRAIQSSEMDHKGYNDISYGYAVDPAGNAFEGRTIKYADGASNQENPHSVSVVYMAGPGTPLTAAAKQTMTELTQWLKTQKPGIARNVSHRDIRPEPTACPGDEVATFVPTIPLIPQPAPVPSEEEDMPVYITDSDTSPWWLFDGYTRRVVGAGENQTLVDLGLVKAKTVRKVDPAYLSSIPVDPAYK